MVRELDQDELIDRWTLVGDELNLVAGKRGATKLGFALLLRVYTERGRFPRGRGEIPDTAVDYVTRQAAVGRLEADRNVLRQSPALTTARRRAGAVTGPNRRS